jgi:hypothetical protein
MTDCVVRQKKAHALTVLPAYHNAVGRSSRVVVSKRKLSWAEIAGSKRRRE